MLHERVLPVRSRGLPALAAILLAAACGGGGGTNATSAPPAAPPAGLGTAVVLAAPCAGGVGAVPDTSCQRLRVEAVGSPPIEVELRVTEPAATSTPVGTVVLGSGGLGTGFYGDVPGGDLLVAELAALGFRVVDRCWDTPWYEAGIGVRDQSARYATLLVWIEANLHTGGLFAASGNSAGAAEVAYALTSWGLADRLDSVVLSAGPPFSRLDFFCDDPASVEWAAMCSASIPGGVFECPTPSCTPEPGNPICPVLPPNPAPGELEDQSVLFPGATLDFPTTDLRAVFGTRDCTSAVPMGLVFLDAVTSGSTISYAAGTAHTTVSNPNGRAAIVQALTATLPSTSPAATYVRLTIEENAGDVFVYGEWSGPGTSARLFTVE